MVLSQQHTMRTVLIQRKAWAGRKAIDRAVLI
jgi:hypothetical protein